MHISAAVFPHLNRAMIDRQNFPKEVGLTHNKAEKICLLIITVSDSLLNDNLCYDSKKHAALPLKFSAHCMTVASLAC